jgi:hypothetical protein
MTESAHLTSGATNAQAAEARTRRPDRELEWVRYAFLAGIVGASVVAILFLVVDLASGRPAFWTPAALGSALFHGEVLGKSSNPAPIHHLAIVLAYTLVHCATFIGFGTLAASERLTRRQVGHFGPGLALVMAALLFLGLEITFSALGWIVGPEIDLATRLGSGWIAVANALAAIAMTATIAWSARHLADRIGSTEDS